MFKRYDKDGDGFVTHEELKAFAKKCKVSITEKEVDEVKEWKENVSEVWSATQMKQAKAEIYRQM